MECTVAILALVSLFKWEHLPDDLGEISRPFCELAHEMNNRLITDSHQKLVMLQRLMEAKDAAVRAHLLNRPSGT